MFLSRKCAEHRNVTEQKIASMGPGCFYPGNVAYGRCLRTHYRASMGPGCFYPGNAPPGGHRESRRTRFNGAGMFLSRKFVQKYGRPWTSKASMGPGCFYPGNWHRPPRQDAPAGLQWGRDVSIPEIWGRYAITIRASGLQWGRDVSIPEIL